MIVTASTLLPCRVVVLESRPTDNPTALSNLYILAGHENSYWALHAYQTGRGKHPHTIASGFGRELRLPLAGSTGQKCKKLKKQQVSDLSVALTPATHSPPPLPCVIDSQRNWSNLKLSLKCLCFWLICTVGCVTTELLKVSSQKCH